MPFYQNHRVPAMEHAFVRHLRLFGLVRQCSLLYHLINYTIFHGLHAIHKKVPLGVLVDLLDRLAGMAAHDASELLADPEYLPGLYVYLCGLPLRPAERLVDEYARVGQGEPLAHRAA